MTSVLQQQLIKTGTAFQATLIPSDLANNIHTTVLKVIRHSANALHCKTSEYLSSVSRWVLPSPIVAPCLPFITQKLQPALEHVLKSRLQLIKANVITKNQYAPDAIAAHQDVSYQNPQAHYDFSVWLSLNQIDHSEGLLECMPYSHQVPPKPAVDFWQPNFKDSVRGSTRWKQTALSYPMHPGDALLFHSHTWHGSGPNRSQKARYALVTRWQWKDAPLSESFTIPQKQVTGFGMWTCHHHTTSLLTHVLKHHGLNTPQNFVNLLETMQQHCQRVTTADPVKVIRSLERVKLLHLASQHHHGGDSQGTVYAQLWNDLLQHLPGANKIIAPHNSKEVTNAM